MTATWGGGPARRGKPHPLPLIFAAIVLALGLAAAPAHAAPAHHSPASITRIQSSPCPGSTVKGGKLVPNGWQTQWIKKVCPPSAEQQSAERCTGKGGAVIWQHGPWRTSGDLSVTYCTDAAPDFNKGNINVRLAPGDPVYYCELEPVNTCG